MTFTSTQKNKYLAIVIGCILFMISINGCDDSFNPIKENDRFYYSLYGYLDTSAETQWIRVVNLQDDGTDGFQGEVTLEDLSTGEQVVMKDSLFQFTNDAEAYNVWTEMDIDQNNTYKIRVERADGKFSEAMIETPGGFPQPEFRPAPTGFDPDIFLIRGVDKLAEASIKFTIYYPRVEVYEDVSISVLDDTLTYTNGDYQIPVHNSIISNELRGLENVEIINCEFYVARGGSQWLSFSKLDRNLIALPNGISNVENGTGYVLGVSSHSIFYPNNTCTDQ